MRMSHCGRNIRKNLSCICRAAKLINFSFNFFFF
jgi:hypothetical protein